MTHVPSPGQPTPKRGLRAAAALTLLSIASTGCSLDLFSDPPNPSHTRPVVRIETQGGVEYGVGTEFGVLFLGRTATDGPCRVHHFYGPDLVVDDGAIEKMGGVYYRAGIRSTHQRVEFHTEDLTAQDRLYAIMLDDAGELIERRVNLADDERISGDVLSRTTFDMPAGTGIFVRGIDQFGDETLRLAGLVAGRIEFAPDPGNLASLDELDRPSPDRFWVFTGPERLREALGLPESPNPRSRVIYRGDDIWVREPLERTTTDPIRRDS